MSNPGEKSLNMRENRIKEGIHTESVNEQVVAVIFPEHAYLTR